MSRYAAAVSIRSETRIHTSHGGADFRREELSLDVDARHFTCNEREPRGPVSLLQIERRAAVSDPGQLLWSRARTSGAASRRRRRSGDKARYLHREPPFILRGKHVRDESALA